MDVFLLHCVIISLLFLCQSQPALCLDAADPSPTSARPTNLQPCTYPTGSIACKTWNHTNVDCGHRALLCIPHLSHVHLIEELRLEWNHISILPDFGFKKFSNLQRLWLSYNNIYSIGNYTFSGLDKLTFLNLEWNDIKVVSGSPFQDLVSLRTLHFQVAVSRLTTSSFSGLDNLEELYLDMDDFEVIKDVSFHNVPLMYLSLHTGNWIFPGCHRVDLVGLSKLTQIRILSPACFDICSLNAIESVEILQGEIYVSDECQTIPLQSLSMWPQYGYYTPSVYDKLSSLTNLALTISTISHDPVEREDILALKAMQWLTSPLQNLTLSYHQKYVFSQISFESATFEPLAKFNASLCSLTLSGKTYHFEIEGTPFQWLPSLQKLLIESNSISSLTESTFKGLENLLELQLNVHHPSVFASGALDVFRPYNSLRVLNLAQNDMRTPSVLSTDLCSLSSSLEYIDISHNNNDNLATSTTCFYPHLHMFIAQHQVVASPWNFNICEQAPNLRKLDFSWSSVDEQPYKTTCPNLEILFLSWFTHGFIAGIVGPNLEELHLNDVGDTFPSSLKDFAMLHKFVVPKLKYLDMSSNKISTMTEDDALLLSNLTYLNLANNSLASFDYLQYMQNVETLILWGNKLAALPCSFFNKIKHTSISELDVSSNTYLCECGIEPFSDWINSEKRVHLQLSRGYRCFLPDSLKGSGITQVDLDCNSYVWMYIVIGIGGAVLLLVVSFMVALYHWNIKNRLFLFFNRRTDTVDYLVDDDENNNNEDENGIPRYDAYVSYCCEDEDWIADHLEPVLEGGDDPRKLCIRGRDIPAHKPILESISLYMKRSRKVIAILSPQYMEDRGRFNKCRFELSLALHRLMDENEHVLILVLLEEIPDFYMTLMLRQLFCNVLCLRYPGDGCGQGMFWHRLWEELKRRVPVDERYEV